MDRMWKVSSDAVQHRRTWVAWPWDSAIWDGIQDSSLKASQAAMERLIWCILNYEDVSLIARDGEALDIERRFKRPSDSRYQVEIAVAEYNDIWVRDTLPTFAITKGGSLGAVNWNFNGWGRRVSRFGPY